MAEPVRLLDDIRIAAPCTVDWDSMSGTDTVRFCGECRLNVYNISNMRSAEAEALIRGADGRVCVRLYRRKDGTVLTRDCPVGVRAAMRRATRAAGVALTALLGLFSGVAARAAGSPQEQGQPLQGEPTLLQGGVAPQQDRPVIMGKVAAPRREAVTVSVLDEGGDFVSSADVRLTSLHTGDEFTAERGDDAKYHFVNLEPGTYTLEVSSGSAVAPRRTVRVRRDRPVQVSVSLVLGGSFRMGDVAAPEPR